MHERLRDTILREMGASITITVKAFAMPSDAEALTLQTEEHAQQLLDQIEGFARRELRVTDQRCIRSLAWPPSVLESDTDIIALAPN